MTGWGVFWNVYRRGSVSQAQTQSKKMNQTAAQAPQHQTATRSVSTTTPAAVKPTAYVPPEARPNQEDEIGWANDFDDVSFWAFIYLK
jgi:hypothetical protein